MRIDVRLAFLLPLLALSCLPTPALLLPGCAKDLDCKGVRVCEKGSCVDPAPRRLVLAASDGGLHVASQQNDAAVQDGAAQKPAAPPVAIPGAASMFHGDARHTGRSRFRVSQTTPKERGRALTRGTVYSSPAITDDGAAIFGSHDHSIRAVDIAVEIDGKKPHGHGTTERWIHETADMVWCSPALGPLVAGKAPGAPTIGPVYVGSDDDHLYALDSADGSVRWSFLAGPCKRAIGFGPEAARCDVDAVTVGPDGTIYALADGLYALGEDGSLKWRFALPTHCAAAPAVGPDGSIYFGCQDGRLYAVAPDGQKRWDFRTGDDVDSAPAVAPDGTIYVGSDDHKLYALFPGGALKWALKTGGDVRSSPALAEDGTIYAGSFDGNLYAVRPDGTVLWSFSTADRILSSPTIDAAGVILIGSQDDRLYAVTPTGRLLWSVLFDGDIDGTPAIGPGGTIWVGSDDKALHVLR